MPSQDQIESKFAIHESSSVRLTERPISSGDIGPSLEGIMRKIEDFFFANPRAVVVIDGLEFLIGLHGFDRVYDFTRNLKDGLCEYNIKSGSPISITLKPNSSIIGASDMSKN